MRRSSLTALAIVCDLVGGVFVLQGLGVIPGSFMTGQIVWSVVGAVLLGLSALLFWIAYKPTQA